MPKHTPRVLLAVMAGLLVLLAACSAQKVQPWPTTAPEQQAFVAQATAAPTPMATAVTDALVPTLAAAAPLTPTQPSTAAATAMSPTLPITSTPAPEPAMPTPALPAEPAAAAPEPENLRSRLGVGVPLNVTNWTFDAAMAQELGMGWYLNWTTEAAPLDVDGLEFAQIVLARGADYYPNRAELVKVLDAQPGALWLIGNEPDVPWQDNKTPEQYARIYHQLYTFIKTLDPSAQVAIGAVSQVTPLRLTYLDQVLAAYERIYDRPMPVDVWNVHAFVLREERDSWGVSIPAGFEDVDQGMLWEIEDHDDLALFRQQIVDFRRWMAQHGQRDKPLIVSEYGILMPEGYGFPPERVAAFMTETFDTLLNARDPEIGYPADDNRLVQRLAWYSLSDTVYPTSNLVDPATGKLTFLGKTFAEYTAKLAQ